MMTTLEEMSWKELAQRLHALHASGVEGTAALDEAERLTHELHVHQIELEMQNRELREAQGRLEASRARYADLYDRAPVGYATLDRHGLVLEMNLTGAAMLELERLAVVGMPFPAIVCVDLAAFLDNLRVARENGRNVLDDVEIPVRRKGGVRRHLQLTTTAQHGETGELTGFVLAMNDVTDRRRAELQQVTLDNERRARVEADARDHMKDQFLGIVSHELRTPLNAILGWLQIVTVRGAEPAIIARAIEVMQRNGRALERLVDDILDVSRIVSGKMQMEAAKVDVDDIVRAALEQFRSAAEAKHLVLAESLESGCTVVADPMRLQQVVSNLLANAIKFTPRGGRIEVSLEPQDGSVRLRVRDSGCGIDAADLPYVFEHFRQADSSTTRAHAGLGLGLAIARHIVEAHGGRIEAHSEGRGKGAELLVELPSRFRSSPPAPISPRPATPFSIAGVKILCVDDEGEGRELLALMLGARGAVARTAGSTEEALELAGAFLPDVVVSDIAMPEQDGYQLIGHLRELPPPLADVPAIALTAYARPDDARRALQHGFSRHMSKPVDADRLVEAIASLLRRRPRS